MVDWKAKAWEELKAYETEPPEELIRKKREHLQEIRERMTSIRSAVLTVPPMGSPSGASNENRLDALIDEEKRLRAEIRAEELQAQIIRSGLRKLTETERTVLEAFTSMRSEKAVSYLIDATGYERAQLYRIKEEALRNFTITLYGFLEF